MRFRRIDGALAGQLEIEPVLAMQGAGGPREPFRLMLLQPGQLNRLLAGVQPGAGRRIMGGVIGSGDEAGRHLGRARIQPEQRTADRLTVRIDQPATVALAGHGKPHRAIRQTRHDRRQIAKRLPGVVPGPHHVLLDTSPSKPGHRNSGATIRRPARPPA